MSFIVHFYVIKLFFQNLYVCFTRRNWRKTYGEYPARKQWLMDCKKTLEVEKGVGPVEEMRKEELNTASSLTCPVPSIKTKSAALLL